MSRASYDTLVRGRGFEGRSKSAGDNDSSRYRRKVERGRMMYTAHVSKVASLWRTSDQHPIHAIVYCGSYDDAAHDAKVERVVLFFNLAFIEIS